MTTTVGRGRPGLAFGSSQRKFAAPAKGVATSCTRPGRASRRPARIGRGSDRCRQARHRIDVESVSHVIKYDCPEGEKLYVLPVTGAAGLSVSAAVMVAEPAGPYCRAEVARRLKRRGGVDPSNSRGVALVPKQTSLGSPLAARWRRSWLLVKPVSRAVRRAPRATKCTAA